MKNKNYTFKHLVADIIHTHETLSAQACKAINISLTLRNWLMGNHIVEYEMNGADRAHYGKNLFIQLSQRLEKLGVPGSRSRQLYYYTAFYRTYPHILRSLPANFKPLALSGKQLSTEKVRSVTAKSQIDPAALIQKLSYTHLELLTEIEDSIKRSFYEYECLRGGWSVRELKRQINTLLYERTGLSKNKKKLLSLVHKNAQKDSLETTVRHSYMFEFLKLKSKEVMGESQLEDALLDKLQDFLLELGHGFCFEARQKRIIMGDEYFFVDLVFYHRVLKCHVLVELKVDDFKHEYLGQLNTYVGYYKKNEMNPGDNPPVGILLCTKKNHALVEYALSGMSNKLFVSKYQVELPKKTTMKKLLENEVKNYGPESISP